MNSARSRVRLLAQAAWEKGDSTGWFEELYASAEGNEATIPWADMQPNPNLVDWLQKHAIDGTGKTALVIGCGLGDDAEELARIGFDVTAFDISQTAIAWCQKRFPNSSVHYSVADLFAIPSTWQQFDFVLEAYTLQALPAQVRPEAIDRIATCISPAGRLLIICRGRNSDEPAEHLPFPLTRKELARFQQFGLQEMMFEDYFDPFEQLARRFRILYQANNKQPAASNQ